MTNYATILKQFLTPDHHVDFKYNIPSDLIPNSSPAIQANSYYFANSGWAQTYFEACHRDAAFRERWHTAAGLWDGKIVVDVGCGPGNLFATLGGSPKLLIGIDVSRQALEMAQQLGYTPLLADAHHLPLVSGFADLVAVNATLHHCEDMSKVLAEAARLVRIGGILIVDHDPQLTAWNYKGLAMFFYKIRLIVYRLILRDLHVDLDDRLNALATEIHHKPGDGVTLSFFYETLESLGFEVQLYPHNHTVGAEALQGICGQPPHWRYRLAQRLSGIDPDLPEAALSIMCVARRNS